LPTRTTGKGTKHPPNPLQRGKVIHGVHLSFSNAPKPPLLRSCNYASAHSKRPAPNEKCVARPPESLPACGGLARLWWACPPGRGSARTNPLRIAARCGTLLPLGETEAGNLGEEPISPTGTFRSAERRAKGYPGQACPLVAGSSDDEQRSGLTGNWCHAPPQKLSSDDRPAMPQKTHN